MDYFGMRLHVKEKRLKKKRRELTVESTRFSSSVLGLCEPRAMATEHGGEKNLRAAWPGSIPPASELKLSSPMTKTTFHI